MPSPHPAETHPTRIGLLRHAGRKLTTLLAITACTSTSTDASPSITVLQDVAVVDVVNGETRAHQTIVIADGRIEAVGPSDEILPPAGAEVTQAEGRYVIPGLWDMHTHVLADWENSFPLLIANGVTGIRNLHSTVEDPLALVLELQSALASNTTLGPMLIANGPIVDGPQPAWPASVAVTDTDTARSAVRDLHDRGADFIKVYDSVPRDAYFAMVDEAKDIGIPLDGHVPVSVRLAEASDAGQRCIEHLNFVSEACTPDELKVRPILLAFFGAMARQAPNADELNQRYNRTIVEEMDAEVRDTLLGRLAANGTWLCPTLVVGRTQLLPSDPAHAGSNPAFSFVRAATLEWWSQRYGYEVERRHSASGANDARVDHYRLLEDIIRRAQAAGVGIVAGSDVGNPFLVPGFSLHDELELLVAAGLSQADALRAATVNPARLLGREDTGVIEPGRRADLVLLDADPLQDIGATRRIQAVVLGGRWFGRAELDGILDGVRERVSESAD